jgi:DNA mismatch endonuclease, patch repair protein
MSKAIAREKRRKKAVKARPKPPSATVRARMVATRRRDTPGELALRAELWSLGLRYRVDVTLPGSRRRADVAFIRAKVAVFVDGCFWHGCPLHGTWPKRNAEWWREKIQGNMHRDRDTNRRLATAGWKVLRFWEHTDPRAAANRVARTLRK